MTCMGMKPVTVYSSEVVYLIQWQERLKLKHFMFCVSSVCVQILIGEAILYCYLSRRSAAQTEANINAAGCNFNSYIRRAVRFIGEFRRQSLS